ncbi:cytochrome ubiquinol oxidase subunit I [Mangrovactinospora gilvigrisea]|uniref:Cytochrome ubiquinol oxidase subunit I n=1 Tax=Mangrovactinospora gilvigrisea TaxID=1428644 RepID=A0A1J7CAF7_9ACTN|nr:cytochrome ubiquinol oxidase subunit I [Mangrovactinospora gilvigrisea]OIV38496.1 cytochrome ubiquinol oxidase subunit I [Mangrovactinospora gilvigrisea]
MAASSGQLDLARWQFGITTVYHYFFVPLTIGLAGLVAVLQTAWVRTNKPVYLKATKFWGKLFLINIAMGVVTGIVQEFQFGMNWSAYSRFVGDVFGAPLAMEALLAFFFESTFVGLWIFGWDKLPKRLHLACIWLVFIGTMLSAYFILAANSFMQHPVGYAIDHATGRARLTSITEVLFQETAVTVAFHTLTACFLTGAAFMMGISAYHLARKRHVAVMRTSLRLSLVVAVIFGIGTAVSGDSLGKVMFRQQPMKMASAEALWETQCPAPFSVFAYGNVAKGHNSVELSVPGVLSFLSDSDFSSCVPGINETNHAEQQKFGPGDYKPNIPVAFWGFRLMIGFGMVSLAIGAVGLWLTRKRFWLSERLRAQRGDPDAVPLLALTKDRALGERLSPWFWRISLLTMLLPLFANSFGWIFTETGRQPWVVYGLFRTEDAVSPGVSFGEVLTSLVVLTALYGILAVIEVRLLIKYAKAGPPELSERDLHPPTRIGGPPSLPGPRAGGGDADRDEDRDDEDADRPLAIAY